MILARHAESMLWVGRYLERVETTARCLQCEANSIIHFTPAEAMMELEQIVRALDLEEKLPIIRAMTDRHQVTTLLLFDSGNPGSIVWMAETVRENLRTVRDRVPIELWEEANALHLQLRSVGATYPVALQDFHEVLLMVRRFCLSISGVLSEGMDRDEGYSFIVIGRMLERSIFTVSLLQACLTDIRGVPDLTRLLRFASALQAYRRRHGHDPDPDVAVKFLLTTSDLPRSVLSCLLQTERCLKGLRVAASSFRRSRRRIGLVRARLEFGAIVEELASGAVPVLTDLRSELIGLSEDVLRGVEPSAVIPAVRSQYLRPGHQAHNDGGV